MGNIKCLFLLVLVMCSYALVVATMQGGHEDELGRREREGEKIRSVGEDLFLLQDSMHVVRTDAGDMRVVRGWRSGGKPLERTNYNMHIGFINMEPSSLFIPQYLDSTLILFVRTGEARIGHIYKDELVEKPLKTGDVYRIAAGSAFYLENTAQGQKLQIICSIDTSESLEWHNFHSFFVGGGMNPPSVLAGFDHHTLSTAFNVSVEEIEHILTKQQSGPIVYVHNPHHPPSVWTRFLKQEHHERKAHLKRIFVDFEEETNQEEEEEEEEAALSFRKLLISVWGMENKKGEDRRRQGPDSYNIYERRPDYKNNYGQSIYLDESDYAPLGRSGIGIFLVNLTAGSMMAPHINPTATEYGIVLRGSGKIQIVYPNGTLAMNARVREGDVFRVPRYFPICHIASEETGSFEFFGFTTSAHKNRLQFLAGSNSLLHNMRGPELAAAFGISEDRLRKITDSQRQAVILPSLYVAPPEEAMDKW